LLNLWLISFLALKPSLYIILYDLILIDEILNICTTKRHTFYKKHLGYLDHMLQYHKCIARAYNNKVSSHVHTYHIKETKSIMYITSWIHYISVKNLMNIVITLHRCIHLSVSQNGCSRTSG